MFEMIPHSDPIGGMTSALTHSMYDTLPFNPHANGKAWSLNERQEYFLDGPYNGLEFIYKTMAEVAAYYTRRCKDKPRWMSRSAKPLSTQTFSFSNPTEGS